MVLHIDVGPHLPNRWSRPRDHAWEGDAALARRRTWGVWCGAWSARKSPRCRVHGKRIRCCIFGCATNASVLQSMMVLHIDKGPHMSNAWNTPLGHETTSQRAMQRGRDQGQGVLGVGRRAQGNHPGVWQSGAGRAMRARTEATAAGGFQPTPRGGGPTHHGGHLPWPLLLLWVPKAQVEHVLTLWHEPDAGRNTHGQHVLLRLVLRHLHGHGGASLRGDSWVHASSDDNVSSGWGCS